MAASKFNVLIKLNKNSLLTLCFKLNQKNQHKKHKRKRKKGKSERLNKSSRLTHIPNHVLSTDLHNYSHHTQTQNQTLLNKRTAGLLFFCLKDYLVSLIIILSFYPQLQLQGPCSTTHNGTLASLLYWEGQEVLERILHFPQTTPTVITESSFVKVTLLLGKHFYFLPTNGIHKQWVAPWNPRWKGPDRRQHINYPT